MSGVAEIARRREVKEKVKFGKPGAFFDVFERRPGTIKKNMHYCQGCGHGILHKLIAEALSEFHMQDRTVFICPVGCSVFAYYYFETAAVSVPHGRAPSVATGIVRSNPDALVISYQGDGDLGAIGFNNFIQAANRGENMIVCFVNNGIYGMTGGQMAPTTLPGQKTMTSPYGRSVTNEGYPMKVSEMVAALDSPVYVERVALSSTKNILNARKALRKAMNYMIQKKGFSLVEFLSACPINTKISPDECNDWIESKMIPYFPLGCLKDVGEQREPITRPQGIYDPEKVWQTLYESKPETKIIVRDAPWKEELRIKCAGFGGQGILSLGTMISYMGSACSFNVTWLPAYGPEMRGGTANCSVVLSRNPVSSPIVNKMNVLVAMNRPSVEKFLPDLEDGGIIIYDSSYGEIKFDRKGSIYATRAADIAKEIGDIRCANSVILGALSKALLSENDLKTYTEAFESAIVNSFKSKNIVIENNIKAFHAGEESVVVKK